MKIRNYLKCIRAQAISIGLLLLMFFLSICDKAIAQTYPPSCVVTMPYSNAYFKAGTDIDIHVYATDIGKTTNNGTVTKVEFLNGNTVIGEATAHTNYTYKFKWTCVQAGTYTIKAKATNDKGVSFTSVGVIITVGTNAVSPKGMSACKGKYLANIIPGSAQINYNTLWNGVTAENACKWGSVEGTRNSMNWGGADVTYNHAKNNNMMFRYHAALWAAQRPSWLFGLSTADARAELVEYMKAIAARYPLADQIDVLNEQLGNHQADNQLMRDKFSGKTNCSPTDYTWQIWLFEQARAIFPNTKLVLNDYGLENSQGDINTQLGLFKVLRDRGIVDGFGTQAHCFNIDGLSASALKSSLDLMAKSGLPTFVTELDLKGGVSNDNNEAEQLASFKTHFPVYWEHPSVAGISIWGYVNGQTWIGGTGLISSSGTEKPALPWLRSYVTGQPNVGFPMCATGACTSTNGTPPTVSITAPTNNTTFELGTPIALSATTSDPDGSVSKVEFYNGTTKLGEDASSPYSFTWTSAPKGANTITAVATDDKGNKTTSAAITIIVNVPQGPYNNIPHPIPGLIQAEEYDLGGNNVAYMDDSPGNSVTPIVNYRTDEDVDIENCTDAGGGYNLGYTTAGEWLEYTVNVSATGKYDLDLRIACNGDGRTITIAVGGNTIANNVIIPNTTGWQTWQTVSVKGVNLAAGTQVMRITIGTQSYINLNFVEFKSIITGMDEESSLQGGIIYPNPFHDNLHVVQAGDYTYQLTDASGQLIESGSGHNEETIAQALPRGLYLLKVIQNSKNKFFKVVKQ